MNSGTIYILISFILSIASLFFFAGRKGEKIIAQKAGERLFYLSGAFIVIAAIMLLTSLLGHSFQYAYVYNYTSRDLPVLYLIAAFWAGQEGTFLLWELLLFIFGVVTIRSNDEDKGTVVSVIIITQLFILLMLIFYSPFRYLWQVNPEQFEPGMVPSDGSGLNPLLKDPWMIIHPPVLFMGYAAATVPFAYAISALIKNEYSSWIEKARKWTLFTMTALGIGIFLGGYWAYKVLGWGGYWGWDPVENSSLIPWLVIIALVHGMILQKRKNALQRANILLALISFILILYATFLTRSGVLSNFSVHSFGDLGLSRHLIAAMFFFVLLSAFMFIRRFNAIKSSGLDERILSWENLLLYGIITICCYSFLILIGTSMPLLSSMFSKNPFSVNTGYYTNISIPLGLFTLLLIAAAGIYQFISKVNLRQITAMIIAAIIFGIAFNISGSASPSAYILSAAALILLGFCITDLLRFKAKSMLASRLSHAGIAVMVLGIIASSMHSRPEQKKLLLGKEEKIKNGISISFAGLNESKESTLKFKLKKETAVYDIETPYYIDPKMHSLYREPHISYGFFYDIYISPVEFQSGIENLTRVELVKDTEKEFQGMKFTFTGFDIDREKMMAGEAKLYAKILTAGQGGKSILTPGMQFTNNGERIPLDSKIPGTGRRLSILDFDVKAGMVYLFVQPSIDAAIPPDSVIVDISFKHLIWMVWLGTILIAVGAIIAFAKRK